MRTRSFTLPIFAAACAGMLAACGGNAPGMGQQAATQAATSSAQVAQVGIPATVQAESPRRSAKTSAANYQNVLQELYVAYYGRPADPAGMVYWEGVLLAANAPTNIAGLNAAYASNAAVQSIVNSFGNSAESQALYGTGNASGFINAIYQNVLGRSTATDTAGAAYWEGLLSNGSMTQAEAALAILSAAATEAATSTDEQVVANRLTVANYFTSQLTTPAQQSAYSGLAANAAVRTMLAGVTASTSTTAFDTTVNSTITSLERFTVNGTVTGLNGTATLQDNGGDAITMTASGSFVFPTSLASGAIYNVTVNSTTSNSAGYAQMCAVTNGAGTVASANVTNVSISCQPVLQHNYGFVGMFSPSIPSSQIISLKTTLTVPSKPPASGTLFLWPGIEPVPSGTNYLPIGEGVLQPVLTWGPSCAPGTQPANYSTWWVSAQYVNTLGSDPGFMGCYGGQIMSVNVGDSLVMTMTLNGAIWTQTVLDTQTGQSVSYSDNLGGQEQYFSIFRIEEYSSAPVTPVVLTNTSIVYSVPSANPCYFTDVGLTDSVTGITQSSDGTTCSIQSIVLRGQGIN